MKYRKLGKTGFDISEVSLGTWQLGGRWGEPFNEDTAFEILDKSCKSGINFIDTADVYNGGLSEKAIGRFLKGKRERIYVATKCGRKLNPHVADGYNGSNIREFTETSLKNMDVDVIDLIQLHCPPTEVYYRMEAFEELDRLKDEGKILHYGVSVEKVEEAIKAIEFPGVATVQIIFNMFRQRPAELFFKEAAKRNVGIIVRVPLASGLLTGKFDRDTTFGKDDHRFYNRDGKYFDKGETFSGVEYEKGLLAVEELKNLFGGSQYLAVMALKWVLMFDEVSCVIPGASNVSQVEANNKVSEMPPLSQEQMEVVKEIYEKYVKLPVHYLW